MTPERSGASIASTTEAPEITTALHAHPHSTTSRSASVVSGARSFSRGALTPALQLPASAPTRTALGCLPSDPFDASSDDEIESCRRAEEARARWEREDDGRTALEDLIADLRADGLAPSLERRLRELVDDVRARRGAP